MSIEHELLHALLSNVSGAHCDFLGCLGDTVGSCQIDIGFNIDGWGTGEEYPPDMPPCRMAVADKYLTHIRISSTRYWTDEMTVRYIGQLGVLYEFRFTSPCSEARHDEAGNVARRGACGELSLCLGPRIYVYKGHAVCTGLRGH